MLNVKLNLKYSNISEKEIIKYAEEVKKYMKTYIIEQKIRKISWGG